MSCRISSAVISRRRCSERVTLSLVLFVPSWSGCRLLTPFESATDVDTTPCSPQASESTFACPTSATALYDRQVTLSNQADRPSSPHCSTSCPSDWYNITSVMPYLRPASRARANDDMKPRRAASSSRNSTRPLTCPFASYTAFRSAPTMQRASGGVVSSPFRGMFRNTSSLPSRRSRVLNACPDTSAAKRGLASHSVCSLMLPYTPEKVSLTSCFNCPARWRARALAELL